MIVIIDEYQKKQTPDIEGNWLYSDEPSAKTRFFAKEAYLPIKSKPLAECTNEEKEAWEREHAQPEPPEPENA